MSALLPPLLGPFALTVALSFIGGLALREYYIAEEHLDYFGSVRTYVFVGMLGFALFQLGDGGVPYTAGFIALSAFLSIYYWRKSAAGKPGLIGVLTALLTYLLGPLALTAPAWFVILFGVSLLFALNAKERIRTLSERITQREVVALATFLTLAGVILPLLPREPVSALLPLTPYQIWLAVVVSTGISYASYLLQTFAFPRRGLLLSGLLGGLYSSTVTTFVIARRTRESGAAPAEVTSALVAATAAMYLRLIALAAIFAPAIAVAAAPLLGALGVAAGSIAYLVSRRGAEPPAAARTPAALQRNPLELSAAALFAVLLMAIATITRVVVELAPAAGLNTLAVLAGLYDIDPFVIPLLQSHAQPAQHAIVDAIVIAAAANNVLKAGYILVFADRAPAVRTASVLVTLSALSLFYVW